MLHDLSIGFYRTHCMYRKDDHIAHILGLKNWVTSMIDTIKENQNDWIIDREIFKRAKELMQQESIISPLEKEIIASLHINNLNPTSRNNLKITYCSKNGEAVATYPSALFLKAICYNLNFDFSLQQIKRIELESNPDIFYQREPSISPEIPLYVFLDQEAARCNFDSYKEFYDAGFRIKGYEDVEPMEIQVPPKISL